MADDSQLPKKGWPGTDAEQRRAWLSLTYEERLRWLEQAMRFCRTALGAARRIKR